MESAEHQSFLEQDAAVHSISSADAEIPACDASNHRLEEEINELRRSMTEAFLKEESFTSDSVMEISRLLDTKIIEYMKLVSNHR
uniref:Aspartyl-phosphate phosphatase Spo0E family protein n=1 Tax=Cohnella lubricantis TaxID=2163172 RepID=A0A841TE64_9BACL|nr:aspartyl-phosphate phosphatase Spo0E family protein [Cohnella lubricantis]MBB6678345.1 aspartyl-phosphate phosphatase Spo0E family protein [Cohnella lubricantis]MBP2116725.1 hypothetical protein [Cohnella lubricantis]